MIAERMIAERIVSRNILDGFVRHKIESDLLSVNDLLKICNKRRANDGYIRIQGYTSSKNKKQFIKELTIKIGQNPLISIRGRGGGTWAHPLLFIDILLWLYPHLKIEEYDWLFKYLIICGNEARDDEENYYKRMCGGIFIRNCKQRFLPAIRELDKLIKKECRVIDWNRATQEQIILRNKIYYYIDLFTEVLTDCKQAIRLGIQKAKQQSNEQENK